MNQGRKNRAAGFTLLELIVVVAIIGLLSVTALEAMRSYRPRYEMRQVLNRSTQLVNKARIEAIKRGVTTVVEADLDERTLRAFADVNGDPTDPLAAGAQYLVYDPDASARFDRTDYLIGEASLPGKDTTGIQFGGPQDGINGDDSVDGFTKVPQATAGGEKRVLVFRSTGAVRDPGAFRFADALEANFFELSVAAITGKTEIRKYLKKDDAPSLEAGFFVEANTTFDHTGSETTVGRNIWVWY